jgi:hypothetical protein
MTATSNGRTPGVPEDADIDEIQADIERTREDLADTVDALSAKLDVKAHAREVMQKPQVKLGAAYVAAAVLAACLVVWWRKR